MFDIEQSKQQHDEFDIGGAQVRDRQVLPINDDQEQEDDAHFYQKEEAKEG